MKKKFHTHVAMNVNNRSVLIAFFATYDCQSPSYATGTTNRNFRFPFLTPETISDIDKNTLKV